VSLAKVTTGAGASVSTGTGTISLSGAGGALDLGTGTFTTTSNSATAIDVKKRHQRRARQPFRGQRHRAHRYRRHLGPGIPERRHDHQCEHADRQYDEHRDTGQRQYDRESGAFTSAGGFSLNDAGGGLNVTGAVADTTGNVSITTTGGDLALGANVGNATGNTILQSTTANITQSAGAITGAGVSLTAGGSIGPVNTTSTGTLALTTSGAGAAGNITVTESNALNTNRVTISTDAGSAQTVSLTTRTRAASPWRRSELLGQGQRQFQPDCIRRQHRRQHRQDHHHRHSDLERHRGRDCGQPDPDQPGWRWRRQDQHHDHWRGRCGRFGFQRQRGCRSDAWRRGLEHNWVSTAAGSTQQVTITSTGAGGIAFASNVDFAGANNDNISLIATAGPIAFGTSSVGNGVNAVPYSGNLLFSGVGVTQSAGSTIDSGAGTITINGGASAINMAGALTNDEQRRECGDGAERDHGRAACHYYWRYGHDDDRRCRRHQRCGDAERCDADQYGHAHR
jgi:hypothetical protein